MTRKNSSTKKKKSQTKNYHFNSFIGIDPGASGGIALISNGQIKAYKCPKSTKDMSVVFSIAYEKNGPKTIVGLEKVWARPTDARSSAFKFGMNYGKWIGISANHETDIKYITPQTWMKYYNVPKLKKEQRKRWLKDKAKELYPKEKVTLYTADAILIAHYLKEIYKEQ